MPRLWYDRHAANKIEDPAQRELYRKIVADKKPYFMRYIYPALMKQYNTYIKNTDRNALREFQMTVAELYKLPIGETTERQREFLRYYEYRMPVGTNDCIMNKICRRFEDEFDGYIGKHNAAVKFDYTIMRSDAEYTPKQLSSIKRLYDDYNRRLVSYAVFADYERVDEYDSFAALSMMNEEFRRECSVICPDSKALCNIILDICYTKSSTKRFAWSMCGDDIIHNLLSSHDGVISYPVPDAGGEFEYCGERYSVETIQIGVDE